jgi:hypothetical protein
MVSYNLIEEIIYLMVRGVVYYKVRGRDFLIYF